MLKICILTTSLGDGGAERSSALLSQLLFNLGYDVHLVITKNILEYSYSGKLFNLELELKGNKSNYNKLKVLKSYLLHNKFDYIIDNRIRNKFLKELILYKFVFKGIRVISVVRSFHLVYYLPKFKILGRILYGNIHKVVAVSKKIEYKLRQKYGLRNVLTIYNPIDFSFLDNSMKENVFFNEKFILFFGRIEESVKNFNLLISGYKGSNLLQNGISLVILGDGPDISTTKKKVKDLKLENHIVFMPFQPNPFPYVKASLFTVLTSRFEGFPRSLLESLACNTPVISVDCDSGPSEVVINKENGLLINNYDAKALSDAMNLFLEDRELYLYCKKNARRSIQHLELSEIALQWKKIFYENNSRN